MEDKLSEWIDDLGSLEHDVRHSAAAKLEAQGYAALHPLVDAMRSSNPIRRMEASQLIIRMVEQIAASLPPLPEPQPDHAATLVAALGNPNVPYREHVEEQLLAQPETAEPALIQALPYASPIHASRIARLLARLQAIAGIPALLTYLSKGEQHPRDAAVVNALDELIESIPSNWRTVGVDGLLALLEITSEAPTRADQLGDAIANALVRMAQEEPGPRLRLALKPLKRPWYKRSIAFEIARRKIEEATHPWKNLPLPAESSPENADLPRPSKPSDTMTTNLPYPVERD
ncbi:MAG: hypothetical protein QM758_28035 [Armatimonas sp.]